MGEFEPNDSDDDEDNRNQADDVVGVAKEDDTRDHGSSSANTSPDCISCSN